MFFYASQGYNRVEEEENIGGGTGFSGILLCVLIIKRTQYLIKVIGNVSPKYFFCRLV